MTFKFSGKSSKPHNSWDQAADQSETKDHFALFFNVCKYNLERENQSLSFGVKYFVFQFFFFSGQFDTKYQ